MSELTFQLRRLQSLLDDIVPECERCTLDELCEMHRPPTAEEKARHEEWMDRLDQKVKRGESLTSMEYAAWRYGRPGRVGDGHGYL